MEAASIEKQIMEIKKNQEQAKKFMVHLLKFMGILYKYQQESGPFLVRRQKACDLLGISRTLLQKLVEQGKLTPVKLSDEFFYRVDELKKLALGDLAILVEDSQLSALEELRSELAND